jgi:hypothetical protein
MAITHVGKLFENSSTAQSQQINLGQTVKAGTLICIALCGRRGSPLDVAAITDSKGNSWSWIFRSSVDRGMGVAWCRTPSAMTTSDWIRVQWNGTPSHAWKSAHAFEGAGGTPTGTALAVSSTNTTTAVANVPVTGSDWLTFASVILPYEFGISRQAGANSSTLRDDNAAASSAPWCECASRNGTTGSSHSPGVVYAVPIYWGCAAVSFPFEAMPAGRSSFVMS